MAETIETFAQFREAAQKTNIMRNRPDKHFYRVGLSGEIGDLLALMKKEKRNDVAENEPQDSVCEEIGDCLWYLTHVCKDNGLGLHDLADCREADSPDNAKSKRPRRAVEEIVYDLIISNGKVIEQLKAKDSGSKDADVESALTRLFGFLTELAASHDLEISKIATKNANKTHRRFGEFKKPYEVFDANMKEEFERLPRKVTFHIRDEAKKDEDPKSESAPKEATNVKDPKAILLVDGYIFGSALEDYVPADKDYFRYHDVFHMAFAAYLGWSPSLRALLNRKRTSNPEKGVKEDGARPRLMEEGLVHLIFRYGQDNEFFENRTGDKPRVAASVLDTIESMVRQYEVQKVPLSLWNDAIIRAFQIFRQVKANKGGFVTVDMDKGTLEFRAPDSENGGSEADESQAVCPAERHRPGRS